MFEILSGLGIIAMAYIFAIMSLLVRYAVFIAPLVVAAWLLLLVPPRMWIRIGDALQSSSHRLASHFRSDSRSVPTGR